MSSQPPLTYIKTRTSRKRKLAEWLKSRHASLQTPPDSSKRDGSRSIRVVCISDTHNHQPTLPSGDILIHAGDLTENGSFEEVQKSLTWLASQPHKHKILVAGNHDVLLDDDLLSRCPERRYGDSRTKRDLIWGDVIYLQDSSVTMQLPADRQDDDFGDNLSSPTRGRQNEVIVFGSPWTPKYGQSAFQYHPDDAEQHWDTVFPSSTSRRPDILVTHGPPHLHLDKRDFHRAGCPQLSERVHRLQPKLHVFGHIHAAYGMERVKLDDVQRIHDQAVRGWAGWLELVWMGALVVWAAVKSLTGRTPTSHDTTFVNAAVVGGPSNMLQNEPIVILL